MDSHRKTLRFGASVMVMAALLRLMGSGLPERVLSTLSSPRVLSAVMLLETGRLSPPLPTQPVSTEPPATEPSQPVSTEPTEPIAQQQEEAAVVFAEEDAALVAVNNVCGYETDVAAGLTQALHWDLTGEEPTVLILHSHATESYENTDAYQASGHYRTRDCAYNMVSIGDRLVQVLEAGGVHAVHDRSLHDDPSYSNSYGVARESISAYLEQYPTISLVLDLHRDAVESDQGSQMAFTTQVDGQDTAKLMLVVGTDASGLSHPHWPENMSLAVKLHAQLERSSPGICRPISFRSQRFNQDMSPGALIVEVGAAGNTHTQALAAAEQLGKAILALATGTR